MAVTVAILVIVVFFAASPGVTTIVIVALPLAASSPRAQTTEPLFPELFRSQVPWLGVDETYVTLSGSTSFRLTAVATAGPAFATVMV